MLPVVVHWIILHFRKSEALLSKEGIFDCLILNTSSLACILEWNTLGRKLINSKKKYRQLGSLQLWIPNHTCEVKFPNRTKNTIGESVQHRIITSFGLDVFATHRLSRLDGQRHWLSLVSMVHWTIFTCLGVGFRNTRQSDQKSSAKRRCTKNLLEICWKSGLGPAHFLTDC